MTLLSVEAISKRYGPRLLFSDVSFGLERGDRLAIIGVNGSGKTSLLRILAGLEPPDAGRVVRASRIHVAYLPQQPILDESLTVIEAVFSGDTPTMQLLRAYEAAVALVAHHPEDATAIARLSQLSSQMDATSAWEAETAAHAILTNLGLLDQLATPIALLSGGQRKRVAMARALVDAPDLLILDEPTNHIDTESVVWLENYLARLNSALVLVTHDRYFLDRVVTKMAELDRGRVFTYTGNYAAFLEQRAEREQREAHAEEARQNLLRRELAWLRRGARARTTKQKAHVERVHQLLDHQTLAGTSQLEIDLVQRRIGKRVVELRQIAAAYGQTPLFQGFSLELKPDDRLGIIGPNGSGKSTLLNLIAGRISPSQGERIVGETIHVAYYTQLEEHLNPEQRVIDYIREAAEQVQRRDGTSADAAQMLERFLFSREQQWALIGTLSGGERRRLYLLRTLIDAPNLLLLDEPTNDLDLQTLAVLEEYLAEFSGAVVVVSHDRYFLDRVVDRMIAFEADGRLVEYPGNYQIYTEYRLQQAAAKPAPAPKATPPRSAPPAAPTPRRLSAKERRELAELEATIAQIEAEQAKINEVINTAHDEYQRYQALAAQLQQLATQLDRAIERWSELAERAELS